MLFDSWYFSTGFVLGCSFASVIVTVAFINIASCFIDDRDFKFFSWLPWADWDNGREDYFEGFFAVVLGFLAGFLTFVAWPAVIAVLFGCCVLFSLRSLRRTQKKVKKMLKVAHSHEKQTGVVPLEEASSDS